MRLLTQTNCALGRLKPWNWKSSSPETELNSRSAVKFRLLYFLGVSVWDIYYYMCRSWYPAVTTGADVWHWGFGNRGPDAASGIPWSAVWHPEVGFRLPTRFRAWSTTIPALHGRLLDIIKDQGIKAHSYADGKQVHVSTGAADVETAVHRFVSCTERIESWICSNRLKMNADKTQVIWIGSRQQLAEIEIKEF